MKDESEPMVSKQDLMLRQLQQTEVPVAVYLQNGIKLQGKIVGFDTQVIMLHSPSAITQMIYKHAILSLQAQ